MKREGFDEDVDAIRDVLNGWFGMKNYDRIKEWYYVDA